MGKGINILMLSDSFNYNCGVSRQISYLIDDLPAEVNVYLAVPGGSALELLDSQQIMYFLVPALCYEKRNTLNFMKSIIAVRKLVKKLEIDLVHSHNYYAANIAAAACGISKVQTVQTVHSYFKREGILRKYSANYYILVNEYLEAVAKGENVYNAERMRVIKNGVKVEQIYPENDGTLNEGEINVLAASRLVYEKGIQTLIEAVSILPEEYQNKINLTIAGTGEYRAALEQLALEKNVSAKFLGEVKDMRSLYFASHIFVLPSIVDGLPMAMLEAGTYNCFIISSDFEGIESVLRNNIDGFVHERHSAARLAESLMKAIDIGDTRKQYANSFKNLVIKKYDSRVTARNTFNYYKQILNITDNN